MMKKNPFIKSLYGKMLRLDIYWITLIIIEIMFIVALVWFATHSLYVTHEENPKNF